MKTLKQHLERLQKVRRREHHPLIYTIHKKHKVSKRTLFYIKEYGPHSNVAKTILRESAQILLLTSLISSFGGLTLEHIKPLFLKIVPLIIMLPTLNDMIGDYGIIVSSRFSTMLHEGKIKKSVWLNKELRVLFIQLIIISLITALLSAAIALVTSNMISTAVTMLTAFKLFLIAVADVLMLVMLLFATSVMAGLYFYKKKEDPNNFLIPITTSIADFGNMALLALLVILFF